MPSNSQAQIATAIQMFRHGALEPGRLEAATLATAEQTGLDGATVMEHWSEKERFIKAMVAHGVIKSDDPSDV
jgi:hypothetical protein